MEDGRSSIEDRDFLSSILELSSILLKSLGVLRRGSARTENFNNFNRSTVRPEVLEGRTETFSAESILHPLFSILMVFMRVAATVLAVAKNERLDHHRHRLGVGQFLADVDKIKVPEIDAVDGNNSGAG